MITARSTVLAISMAIVVLSACSPTGPIPGAPAPREYDLWINNGINLAVTLVVNGSAVRTFAPGVQGSVATNDLPSLPWVVEARAPSGRVLSSMTVRLGDVWATTRPDGSREMKGNAVRVDLSCGRLDMWSGPPLLGPPPGPGRPGDCEP